MRRQVAVAPGFFRQSTSTLHCHAHAFHACSCSPAARRIDPRTTSASRTPCGRAKCVYEALCKAQSRVGPAIKEETGCALIEALPDLPAVVTHGGALAASAAPGRGGRRRIRINSPAAWVAIPGAAAGAAGRDRAGMLLLNGLGIGFLAVVHCPAHHESIRLGTQGVREAWDAPSSSMPTSAKIDHASRSLARALRCSSADPGRDRCCTCWKREPQSLPGEFPRWERSSGRVSLGCG